MEQIVSWANFVVLAGILAYVGSILYGQIRRTVAVGRIAALEQRLLALRLDQVTDARRFERERTETSWAGLRKFEIVRKVPEGGGVCSFYLRPHDRKPLPSFLPGQYLTFQLNVRPQQKPVVRCYSLSCAPRSPNYYRVSIKRIDKTGPQPDAPPGLVSSFFHDRLKEGDIVDVKAPAGHFTLDPAARTPVVLIGGGIGLTPVLSMLEGIVASGSTRETWFFFGVRGAGDHVMRERLAEIAQAHPNVHLQICYSDPAPGEAPDGIRFHQAERVSIDLFKRLLPSNNYDYYVCGPPPMMQQLVADLLQWGVPESRIHFEAFGPATVKRTAAAEGTAGPAAATIEVIFAKSSKTCSWTATAGSILDLADANGVQIDSGCRAGNCGTCTTALKQGEVSYLSPPGAPPMVGSCLACIAIPKSAIILDA